MRSLRGRLILILGSLLVVSLAAVGALVYLSVRNSLASRADERTREVRLPRGLLAGGPITDPPGRGPGDSAYAEIRLTDGRVLAVPALLADGTTVSLDVTLPATLPEPTNDQFGAATFQTVQSAAGPFRVKVSRLANGDVLIVGVPFANEQATLRRLARSEMIAGLLATLAASIVGWFALHRGLRPLADVERSALRISAGELGHRLDTNGQPAELSRVADTLNGMLDQLSGAIDRSRAGERRMRQFVADASHELRTPVAAIAAYAELFSLGAASRPDDLARAMAGIQRETSRASRLIDDLTILARGSEHQLEFEHVDLDSLAADAIDTSRAIDDRWPIDSHLAEGVAVWADPVAMRRVIDNVLGNVRTHTPPGTPVLVVVERVDAGARLVVADGGPGLTAEQLTRATGRFWRADASRTRATGGSGLGLAIAHALVVAHDGTIELAAADPPPGLSVMITLPAIEAPSNGELPQP